MITEKGIVPVKGGQYKLLSEDQLKALHDAAMRVLSEVGIKIMHNDALDLMKGNGCDVDYDKQVVKIPQDVLMKYVRIASRSGWQSQALYDGCFGGFYPAGRHLGEYGHCSLLTDTSGY